MINREGLKNFLKITIKYVTILLIVFVVSIPFFWMVLSSLKVDRELCSWPPNIFPRQVTFQYFQDLETHMNISVYMKNSLIVAMGTIVLCLFLSTIGAYALTRGCYSQQPSRAIPANANIYNGACKTVAGA